jgi:hypothetical protein
VRARIAFHQARVDSDERRQAAPTVRGDAGAPFGIGVSVEVPWNTDPSYDVFSDDDVTTRVGLFAAYDLLSIGRDVVAAAELGWAYDGEESSIFAGNVQTELEQHFFHGGVYVRYVLVDWLQPQLRLQGGISTVDLELLAERRFEQDEITPFGKIGAGVMLRTPTRLFEDERGRLAALSLGVLIEGGYGIASPVEVVLDGPGPGAMDIALEEAQLGELKRSGPFVRTSLVARF